MSDTKQPEKTEILQIDTLAPKRPVAVIDKETHEYRLLQEFGATEHQQLTVYSGEYDDLFDKAKLNGTQGKRMEWLLDWLVDHVLRDPKRLRAQLEGRLTGVIKREIVLTFTNAPLLMAAMAQQTETQEPEASSTTES